MTVNSSALLRVVELEKKLALSQDAVVALSQELLIANTKSVLLAARIMLAKRLSSANLPGFIVDALDGDLLENKVFLRDTTILEYLDVVERNESSS